MSRISAVERVGRQWPAPSFWESPTLSSNVLEESKLMENEGKVKEDLRGLLGWLNKIRKREEIAARFR